MAARGQRPAPRYTTVVSRILRDPTSCLTWGLALHSNGATLVVYQNTALLFGGHSGSTYLNDLHAFDFGESSDTLTRVSFSFSFGLT